MGNAAREALGSGPKPPTRGATRSRRGASWRRTGPRQVRGVVKSARAFRLPPGVDPVDVERRITIDADSGRLLEDIVSGQYGLRACEASRRLDAVRNLDVCIELRDPELACNFVEDSGIGEKIGDSERDERAGEEVLVDHEEDGDTYSIVDESVGGPSVAAGVTPATPANNEPSQRIMNQAGVKVVATRSEPELMSTSRAAEDPPRVAIGPARCPRPPAVATEREAHEAAEARGASDRRPANALMSSRTGMRQSRAGQNHVSWADESDSDDEWLGHEFNVPSVRDVRVARSSLRYCGKRDANRVSENVCQSVLFQQFVHQRSESNVGSTPILGSNRVEGGSKRDTGEFRGQLIGTRIDCFYTCRFSHTK